MSTASNPEPSQERRRRRIHNEPKGWKAVPSSVKIIGALCVAILILIPVARDQGWFKREAVMDQASTGTKAFNPGLEVLEARFDPATRVVSGVVKNSSKQVYQDIHVSYYVRDGRGMEAGLLEAAIAKLEPNQTVPFKTGPMPPEGRLWSLREISGDAR